MKLGFVEAVKKGCEYDDGDYYRIYMPGDITQQQSPITAIWNNADRTQDAKELHQTKLAMSVKYWRLFDE